MPKPIHVEVPTTTKLTIKQAQVVPYLEVRPLREKFVGSSSLSWTYSKGLREHGRYYGRRSTVKYRNIDDVLKWDRKAGGGTLEIQFPFKNWKEFKVKKDQLLSDPRHKTALYFIAGKNFKTVTGHPSGTELFMIGDDLYRRLTWRSITMSYWDKRQQDAGISWTLDNNGLVYFLWKCEKVNQEPLRSIIIDGIGIELLERDRPISSREEDSYVIR